MDFRSSVSAWLFELILIILLGILAFYSQTFFLIHGDVSYLLTASEQLLKGGQYGIDIFETNPPLILYLYAPSVLLHTYLFWDIVSVTRVMVIVLACLSLICSSYLLNKIILKNDQWLKGTILLALSFILLFFPGFHFAQREHFLLIFMMPYLFLAIGRLENSSISRSFAFLMGLFAGMGFAIKPYFLWVPVLIELTMISELKIRYSLIRIETVASLVVWMGYLVVMIKVHTTYLSMIYPLLNRYYFPGIKEPIIYVLLQYPVLYCVIFWEIYFITFKKLQYRTLLKMCMMAQTGLTIAFIIPGTEWYYHQIPALALSYLIFVIYLNQSMFPLVTKKELIKNSVILITIVTIIAISQTSLNLKFKIGPAYSWIGEESQLTQIKSNNPNAQLIAFLKTLTMPHSVMCFSNMVLSCFPSVYYAQFQHASYFPFFWWIGAMIDAEQISKDQPKLLQDKNFLISKINQNLITLSPHYIMVLNNKRNYIAYLSKDPTFEMIWKKYYFYRQIGDYTIYENRS